MSLSQPNKESLSLKISQQKPEKKQKSEKQRGKKKDQKKKKKQNRISKNYGTTTKAITYLVEVPQEKNRSNT